MNILTSISSFGFFTLLSRILGYVRDILIAVFVGTSALADSFFVAFRLPNTFRRLFAEGTFNAAFVPIYAKLIGRKKKSFDFANQIFNFLFLFLIILVLLAEVFTGGVVLIISPGFKSNPEKFNQAVDLTRITFPFLFFVSLSSFYSAILNSYKKFAVAAALPIILNIFLILSLLISYYFNQSYVRFMAYAVFLAGLAQLILLVFYSKKYFFAKINFKILLTKNIKKFFTKLLPSVFSSGIVQINILIGTIIASFQPGAVSYLYYADRIYQLPLALTGIAIGTVILPILSALKLRKEKQKISFLQNRAVELSLFLALPASVGIILAAEIIISSLFGYGSFDKTSVKKTYEALVIFGFGLPAFSLIKLYSNFYFARENTKTPFYISLLTAIINILISVIFFKLVGFLSIAFGTTISSWSAIFVYKYLLLKNRWYQFDKAFFIRITKIIFCTTIMGLILYLQLVKFSALFETTDLAKFLYLILIISISLISYFILSVLIKSFSIKDFKIKN